MKHIVNWERASVSDIETNALLPDVNKIHIIGVKMHGKGDIIYIDGKDHDRVKKFLNYHIDNKIPIVGHNYISFDVPAMEKVLRIDLSGLLVIDTLVLSWYLNTDKASHSIENLAKDYPDAMEKYYIDEGGWENLSWDEAVKRVTADVQINEIIWNDFKERLVEMYSLVKENIDEGLVGGSRVSPDEKVYIDRLKGMSVEKHINRILSFLMFKMDCARLQEETRWKVDVEYLKESQEELSKMLEDSATTLESVMPPVPKYVNRTEPKRPFKKDGTLSASGQRWEDLKELLTSKEVDEHGNPRARVMKEGEIQELTSYDPPNINSVQQVKDFLTSKGWEPQTFNYVRDKEAFDEWIDSRPSKKSGKKAWDKWNKSKPVDRAVPQISKDGDEGKELCDSVLELAERVPEVKALENFTMIKHRHGLIKGFFERMSDDGYLAFRIHGFTNTLRVRHSAPTVNLPSADKPFAEPVRGCLVADDGWIQLGADLKSLEDRVKHHFMIPLDPDLVKEMSADDYDPHIHMCLTANMMDEDEAKYYKDNKKETDDPEIIRLGSVRHKGKTTVYASVYKAGPATIARAAGCSIEEAKEMHDAYWNLFWSVEAIAKEQVVVNTTNGLSWLINPLNGLMYSIRSEKDIFSTLAQGTGSFIFDMWVDNILTKMEEKWNKRTMTASFHKILWH